MRSAKKRRNNKGWSDVGKKVKGGGKFASSSEKITSTNLADRNKTQGVLWVGDS